MTYKELKIKLKKELKEMAKTIRSLKAQRKTHVSKWHKRITGCVPGLDSLREDFRIKHLTYCMLRGTPYEKIESKHKYVESLVYVGREHPKSIPAFYGCVYKSVWVKDQADKLLEKYQSEIKEDVA